MRADQAAFANVAPTMARVAKIASHTGAHAQMMIAELPTAPEGRGLRIWVQGSCRLNGPLWKLSGQEELRVVDEFGPFSHTSAEALQITEILLGERSVPPSLYGMVVEAASMLPPHRARRSLGAGVEVCLLEICATHQFGVDGVFFTHTAVTEQLVAPLRDALLPWLRELDEQGAVSRKTADAALARAAGRGATIDAAFERLIREMTFTHHSEQNIADDIAAVGRRLGGTCVVMGSAALAGAGAGGATMADRRERNREVEAACAAAGAIFFDPGALVARHGRETAMAAGGANIHEWEPAFHMTVARALVDVCRETAATGAEAVVSGARPETFSPEGDLADRVNDELLNVFRNRSEAMDADDGGLMNHYQQRAVARQMVGRRERAVLELARAYLPPFESYEVLSAGVGKAALLLAAQGVEVTAYERRAGRRAALAAAAERLRRAGMTPNAFRIGDTLPSRGPRAGRGASLLVAVGAIMDNDASVDAEMLPRLDRFEALLIDPRVFLRKRETDAEQAELFSALAARGFDRWRSYTRDAMVYFWRSKRMRGASRLGFASPCRDLTTRPRTAGGGRGGGGRT